jgi:hypothetical protein
MKNNAQGLGGQVPPGGCPGSSLQEPDLVDLALEDSFPASDPPPWTLGSENRRTLDPAPAPAPTQARQQACTAQIIDLAAVRARRRGMALAEARNPIARIYRPAPSVMQGGRARSNRWVLEFLSSTPPFIEPLMGWTGSTDTRQHVILDFGSREDAVTYARRQGLPFYLAEPHERRPRARTYAENFTSGLVVTAPP